MSQTQQQDQSPLSNKSENCQKFDTCQKLIIGFLVSTFFILVIILVVRCYLRKYKKQKQVIVQIRPINVSNLIRFQLSQSLALKSLQDQSEIKEDVNNNLSRCIDQNDNQNELNDIQYPPRIVKLQSLKDQPFQKSAPIIDSSRILSNQFQNQRYVIKQQYKKHPQQDQTTQQVQIQSEDELNSSLRLDGQEGQEVDDYNIAQNKQKKYNTIQVNSEDSSNQFQFISKSELILNNQKIIPQYAANNNKIKSKKLPKNFSTLPVQSIPEITQQPEGAE
ncbi:hypothetical protein ABPG74_018761 [Tetrahymena malaccensis]